MPYTLHTTVANYDTALGHIRDFLNATGDWTIEQDLIAPDENSSSGGRQLVVVNGDVLAGLRSTDTGLGANRLFLFDGIPPFSGSPSLDTMNNNSGLRYPAGGIATSVDPTIRHMQTSAGPFPSLHLFTDDPSTYLHSVFETEAGVYRHLAFGNLKKFGTWTGGAYYAAHYWSTAVNAIDVPNRVLHHVVFDNFNNSNNGGLRWTLHYEADSAKWVSVNGAGETSGVTHLQGTGSVRGGWQHRFTSIPASLFSGLVPLFPITLGRVRISDTPDTVRFVGQVRDIRMVNLTHVVPGASLFIGSDEYLCFPLMAKNGAAGQFNSGTAGLAYLKV